MINGVDELLAQSSPEEVLGLFEAAKTPPAAAKETQAQILIRLAAGTKLFHTPDGEGFAVAVINGHLETLLIRSKGFRDWLMRLFYSDFKKPPASQALNDVVNALDANAQIDGPKALLHVRVAGHAGRIYLDLCNENRQVVEIDSEGWRLISNAPVHFRRSKGMRALPIPIAGGSLQSLRSYINVGNDDNWTLCQAWLLAALRPTGPYPALVLQGEQGSAKSTMVRFLRKIVDPSVALVRTPPRDDRDLLIAANNSWVLAYDNVSRIPQWFSDSLCRVATGSGFSTRELYTNSEEAFFDAARPIILNGIDHLTERPDLADRALIVHLPTINAGNRKDEEQLYANFDRDVPGILGGLLYAVSIALATLPSTRLSQSPRMADFARWATAGESGFGLRAGAFLDAYQGNRADAVHETLEGDAVASALLGFMEESGSAAEATYWEGTCEILLEELERHVSDGTKRSKAWPNGPRGLSGQLRRLKTFLREAGFDVVFHPRGGKGKRVLSISRTAAHSTVTSVTSSTQNAPSPTVQIVGDDVRGDGTLIAVAIEPSPENQPSPGRSNPNSLNLLGLPDAVHEGGGGDGHFYARSASDDGLGSPINLCIKCGRVDWEWNGNEWVCPKCGRPSIDKTPALERFEI